MSQRKISVGPKHLFWSLLCVPLLILAACGSGNNTVKATPTAAPTFNMQLQPLNLGIPQAALSAPITGSLPDSQVLHVGVTFKIDPATIKKFDTNGSDTNQNGSDLAKSLGISDQEYQNFKTYFGIQNATVNLNQAHTWMTVDIKAGSLAQLMQTKFVMHKLNNRSFYTPDPKQMPKVPAQLANQILSVTGLDNYSQPARPGGAFTPASSATTQSTQNANADCAAISDKADWNGPILLPADYVRSYGLASFQQNGWYGQGQKVLLVEPIDAYSPSDVNAFFGCANFKGSFNTVTVDGAPPVATDFDESTLDLDVIASVAPQAQIVDYQGDSLGAYQRGEDAFVVVNDLLQRIIDDYRNDTHSGTVISMSFGGNEADMTQADLTMINQSLQILTQAEHMTIFVASGDCAAFATGTYGQLGVSFPASDPWVVATGGTILNTDGNSNRTGEVAWSDSTASHSACNNSWGSGGGVSTIFQEPSWQQQDATSIPGLHNQYSTGYRQVPDLAAAATNNLCYMNGRWGGCSGTSAATPLVASGTAILNGASRHNLKLYFYGPSAWYSAQSSGAKYHPFNEITQGNNLYYQAGSTWNYPTGLGTPNFAGYYQSLQLLIPGK
ncbi:MAG TPA: S53 family peptidase [Ktedonobacteraceae bacterium]|jgi:kumamolisin|nr:S53 family peptidase [Ktedonobacteraceae bacterium]